MKYILRRKYSEKLNICVVGKPNVGKSTLFNHLSSYSNIENKHEMESLVHPEPGLTRDCRSVTVKGVLPVPINFHDTPGIDFLIDKIRIQGLRLSTFGNLFSYNILDDVNKDAIWEFANFIQSRESKGKKVKLNAWQQEFISLLRNHQKSGNSNFGVLEKLLCPEQSISEFLYPIIYNTIDAHEEGDKSISKFALTKIIENASLTMEKADLIFFMVDAKNDIDLWDLHLADWIKFLLARQEIIKHLDLEVLSKYTGIYI
jgi:GTPase SAR1 family protein